MNCYIKGIAMCVIYMWMISMLMCVTVECKEEVKEVSGYDELYEVLLKANMEFDEECYVKSKTRLTEVDFSKVSKNAKNEDTYRGYTLYGIRCKEFIEDEYYCYKFHFTYYSSKLDDKFIEKRVKKIGDEIKDLSDYEKIKSVHDYLILNAEYYIHGAGPYAALQQGLTACNGYSLAFQRIMDEVGIPCKILVGDNHMWNSVYLEGHWYNIDVTWDDPGKNGVSYDYFLKCNDDWEGHISSYSDADKSYPLGDVNYRHKFKHYRLYDWAVKIGICMGIILSAVIVREISRRVKRKRVVIKDVDMEEYRRLYMSDEEYVVNENSIGDNK